MWTGGGVGVTECPKPIITAFSLMCLEGLFALKLGMDAAAWDLVPGKVVDAWHVLDEELRKEQQND